MKDALPILLFTGALAMSPLARAADTPSADPERPLLGAIRWDAWSGGKVTGEVERSLGPKKYHFRLPFFAKVLSGEKVEVHGGTQEVMDREIAYAADAGIDYWAFLIYPEGSDMTVALKNYLASKEKNRVKFATVLHQQLDGKKEDWPAFQARIVGLWKEPTYQTVLDGRPLVYMFHTTLKETDAWRFASLREAAKDAGLKDPYLAYMGFNPKSDWPKARALGFDALSAYALPGQGSFAGLAAQAEKKNADTWRDVKAPAIPLATTGWDKRPRMDHPVSWEKDHDYHKTKTYTETATPEELAAHVARTLEWTRKNPDACPAQSVIVYAWNENDEGGWLAPTLKADGTPDTARLDALRKVLQKK